MKMNSTIIGTVLQGSKQASIFFRFVISAKADPGLRIMQLIVSGSLCFGFIYLSLGPAGTATLPGFNSLTDQG